jgi:hypothetical protein
MFFLILKYNLPVYSKGNSISYGVNFSKSASEKTKEYPPSLFVNKNI